MANTALTNRLQDNLRSAVAAELTTLPTYLYSYWSIKPTSDGGSQAGAEAAKAIMSVILEEMLHMALSSNILNALGGTPSLTTAPYFPNYPCKLLRSPALGELGVEVCLRRLSCASIDDFLLIELPERDDPRAWTLKKFYDDEVIALLPPNGPEWQHDKQLPPDNNPAPGRLMTIQSHDDAVNAITEIVDQGEGCSAKNHDDGDHELAHYWKFKQVQAAVENGTLDLDRDVYPVVDSPSDHVGSYTPEQAQANLAFNSTYSKLLDSLEATLQSDAPNVFAGCTSLMSKLGQQAAFLRQRGFVPNTEFVAGPTFSYIPVDQRAGA